MAAQSFETNPLPLPGLTAEFLHPIVAEAHVLDHDDFRHEELDIMAERNASLKLLFAQRYEWGIKNGIEKADEMGWGYFLAHRVLRLAVGDTALPQRSSQVLEAYVAYTDRQDGRVLADFSRDYEDRPAVRAMVDDLETNPQRYGARLLFAIYGGWANPMRKPILIPTQAPVVMKHRRHSSASAR